MQKTTPEPRDLRTDRGTGPAEQGSTLIRVYEYGCGREAIRGMDIASDQMLRRNELWNRMVEIDNEIRTKMEAALFAGESEEGLRLMREELKQLRSRSVPLTSPGDSSKGEGDQIREQIKTKAAQTRAALDEVKRARKLNADRNRTLLRELDADRLRRIREAQSMLACTGAVGRKFAASTTSRERAPSEQAGGFSCGPGMRPARSVCTSRRA